MANDQGELVVKPFSAYLPVAITAVVLALVPGALVTSCMSIFFPLLAQRFSVNVSQITVYYTIGGLLMAFAGPAIGRFCQKFDIRAVAATLLILIALGYFMMAAATSYVVLVVAGSIMLPCAMLTIGMVNPTIINRWFKDRAGALIGFAAAFTGVGGVIFIQVDQAIISSAGYQMAFVANALFILIIALPCVAFLIKSKPSDKGMLPYVKVGNEKQSAEAQDAEALKKAEARNWSVDPKIATRSGAFWILCIGVALSNTTVMIAQFFPTYVNSLANSGVTAFVTGATLATFTMAGQAICKFILGAGSDFSPKKTILASSAIGVVAVLCIWLSPTTALLPIGGLIFGMFYATPIVLMPLVAGTIFGTGDNYSVIWGRTMLPSGILASPAGVLWPWISENFGGFGAVFGIGIVCIVVFAILMFLALRLGKKLPHEEGTIKAAEAMKEREAQAAAAD
ncbi:MAG: MFS transporter [Eggerthellaceae bacterium]|jgi:OFA family oxalate/formate antiporter-like MFS transporter